MIFKNISPLNHEKILLSSIFLISFFYFSLHIINDYLLGGNSWKQGDWLINSQGGPTRRSLLGDGFIFISGATGINLLLLVAIAQIFVALFLYLGTYKIIISEKNGALCTIALSSSFFLFFWAADPQGSGRKEIITFLALNIISLSLARDRLTLSCIGFSIYVISVFSHEAMILFLPAILFSYLCIPDKSKIGFKMKALALLLSIASILAFYLAVRNAASPDTSAICNSVLALGVSTKVCGGAIQWLNYDFDHGVNAVQSLVSLSVMAHLLVGYCVALAPAFYIAMQSTNKNFSFLVIFASALPFLPLYFFAIDFGRWMSFHIFSIFFLFSISIASGRIVLQTKIDLRFKIIFGVVGLLFIHGHVSYIYWGGVVRRLASHL